MSLATLGFFLFLVVVVLAFTRLLSRSRGRMKGERPGNRWRPMVAVFGLALCAIMLAGCNDFERTTFQSLSASKAVIDQAQAEYEARTIPHVQASFDAITKAKQAQTAAVDAMLAYESIKTAKGSSTALQAQQQIVMAALAQIPPILADVKLLIAPVKTSKARPAFWIPYGAAYA